MALQPMYPSKPGSPLTSLAEPLAADGTSMTLDDATVLPSAPNIAVIGSDSSAEIVSYTAITGNVVSGLVRGLGGTTASAWTTNTAVARNITSYDHDTFKYNIEALNTEKISGVAWGDVTGTLSNQTDLQSALNAKQDTLTFDSTPTASSNKPVTSGGIYEALTEKVAKAGDTMTGDLIIKNNDLDNTDQSRTANTTRNLYFRDKNNKNTAYIANTMGTSGSITTGIYATRQNGNNSESNYLWLQITKDFEKNIVVSHPTAWRTGLNIADMGIVEDSNTATHAISAGQYVIWEGKLYTANSAIAVGTTLSTSNLTERANGGLNHLSSDIFDFKRYRKLTSASDLNNLDQADSSGVYYLSGVTTSGNAPVSYGMLFNLRVFSDTIFQFIVGMDGCYYRYKGGSPTPSWRSWYKLTGTAV